MNKFYFTSAIPYVNATPHIGHAQEFVYADVIRRFKKRQSFAVKYLCGADENGLKIIRAAEEKGLDPYKFTHINQKEFLELAEKLQVEFDFWQRGTDAKHHKASKLLWQKCEKSGDIYKKNYTGLYCVGCEAFYTKDELDENGECYEHPGRKLEKVTEENYFFRLSKYQKFLEELISSDQLKVIPDFRKNEALSFIRRGLEDFSISRSRARASNWGVEVPSDPNQIIYVWFDALNIYQSGIGFGWDEKLYKSLWPADLHVIGKGILRFHAIYWIAILKSAGLLLPKSIFVHGYLTVNGQKMSKTVGNVINPADLIKKYGSDPLRYYLLREIPSYQDGDFSKRRFKELYNADLANGLGNLVARIAKLGETDHLSGVSDFSIDLDNIKSLLNLGGYFDHLEKYEFNLALEELWRELKKLDSKLDHDKPWKRNAKERESQLYSYIKRLLSLAYELEIFLPLTSKKIASQFSRPKIITEKPLFPRLK